MFVEYVLHMYISSLFDNIFLFGQFDDHTQYTQPRYQQSFDDHNKTEQSIPFLSSKSSALVHYQNPNRQLNHAASAAVQYFDALPTIDLIDPMQAQFMYQTSALNASDAQNQINKYRILCNAKDRKITELENRCAQYQEKYNSELRVLKHKIELSDRKRIEVNFIVDFLQHGAFS